MLKHSLGIEPCGFRDEPTRDLNSMAVIWAQFGPYHLARVSSLAEKICPSVVHAIELADGTSTYDWSREGNAANVITLCPGSIVEELSFATVFQRVRQKLTELGVQVCLLPSYSPKQSLAALLAARSLRIRTVMMNESHAGTARATGVSAAFKRRLVRLFDAALVGGQVHRRYFASLGMPDDRIFTGYDAVDNEHFARTSKVVRSQAVEFRSRYQLPNHYFLILGRLVSKKNLGVVIQAYRTFVDSNPEAKTHLVIVGSGEEGIRLRDLALNLRLPVYEKSVVQSGAARGLECEGSAPGVHFYGFRQIEQTPVFYSLANAFILPSIWEEWGLVVNEAMACGLPVIVSEKAGCAEDLLETAFLPTSEAVAWQRNPWLRGGGCHLRRNGFLFDPKLPGSLANALMILESFPSLRDTMGKESERIIEKFSCANFAQNALAAARTALGPSTHSAAEACRGTTLGQN